MRYFVCVDKKEKKNVLDRYSTEEEALKRLKYHAKKEQCSIYIIPVPELKIGCDIYRSDGSYYGTLTYETNSLWGISNKNKDGSMSDPYSKNRIEEWILNYNFIVVDNVDIPKVDEMIELILKLKTKTEDILKPMEFLNVEQVRLFK